MVVVDQDYINEQTIKTNREYKNIKCNHCGIKKKHHPCPFIKMRYPFNYNMGSTIDTFVIRISKHLDGCILKLHVKNHIMQLQN